MFFSDRGLVRHRVSRCVQTRGAVDDPTVRSPTHCVHDDGDEAESRYAFVVQRTPSSFHWTEDHDPFLNFWFWLRREGDIDEAQTRHRLREWANAEIVQRHDRAQTQSKWREFLPEWQAWKTSAMQHQASELQSRSPAAWSAFYRTIADVGMGVPVHVQWVMAAVGERWLVPPDLIVLGTEGASATEKRAALLEAVVDLHRGDAAL